MINLTSTDFVYPFTKVKIEGPEPEIEQHIAPFSKAAVFMSLKQGI